eukprot:6022253-Pyramimonas_sp.AAC.1
MAPHSFLSEASNLARSSGLSFFKLTSPPRPAAKTPPSPSLVSSARSSRTDRTDKPSDPGNTQKSSDGGPSTPGGDLERGRPLLSKSLAISDTERERSCPLIIPGLA